MKKIIFALLLITNSAYADQLGIPSTVNNATVNMQGINQNVFITQYASGHSANLQLSGNGIEVSVNQSGITPQSFSLSVTCGSNCPNSPYIINQY